jgi:hypothetical protein
MAASPPPPQTQFHFLLLTQGRSIIYLSDERRLAVLKPDMLEIWDIVEVAQEHRYPHIKEVLKKTTQNVVFT